MADESGRGEATVAKVSLLDDDFAVAPPNSNTGIRVPDETDDAAESKKQKSHPRSSRRGVVSRTIDLGDGSGKQVFTAPTAEELLDKLTTAQENATRKIRQQEYRLKRQQRHRPETEALITSKKRDLSERSVALANELQKNPAAAINKLVEASTGSTLDDLGKVVADYKTQSAINAADTQFLLNHQDDFLPSGKQCSSDESISD